MAPRRRKKRGNTRLDAALDAMRPYGFSEKLVQETVGELLNVYGGDDGWVFIEEVSYILLVETILEKLKAHAQEGAGSSQGKVGVAVDTEAPAVGPTNGVTCPKSEAVEAVSQTNQATWQTNEALDTASVTHESQGMHCLPPPVTIQSKLPMDGLPMRSRRPYHGWISNDDDEELVHLKPAPLQQSLAKMLTPVPSQESLVKFLDTLGRRSKRKTRWDVRPQDV
ncbi:hypothetical protein I3760_16G100900 [Carya illinoinensis]|uniref:WIYLD domain-containing protein n=2 Tax=Carya illinoinensis TaxID=32201 RepID=A0A922A8P7_CARIL|nr:hypothetical protein I3760_16G100900 [Carya illinoinensis]KAG6673125.1 hypothetical protein I3842_16G096600 [Carya illinoinensis]